MVSCLVKTSEISHYVHCTHTLYDYMAVVQEQNISQIQHSCFKQKNNLFYFHSNLVLILINCKKKLSLGKFLTASFHTARKDNEML